MISVNLKHTLFATPIWMFLLFFSLTIPVVAHAKIETAKLLYLREALAGKTTDKARMITLAAVTSFALAELGITYFYYKHTMRNGYFFQDEAIRNYCYERFGSNAYLEKRKQGYINNQIPIPPEKRLNNLKEENFREKMLIAFGVPAFINFCVACFLSFSFFNNAKIYRPTTNTSALKYPLLFGLNTPGVLIYRLCQKYFFDYQHNLKKLLEHYDSTKIPTIFLPTFDNLAAEYKKHKKISMDAEVQAFFVLSILRKIQEELLEEITIFQFPQMEIILEKYFNKKVSTKVSTKEISEEISNLE